jgi:hypothetical protein
MQPETLYAKRLDKRLKSLPLSHWFNIQQASLRGTPDRLGTVAGRFVALEIKISKKAKRSKLQEYYIGELKKAGAFAEFIYPENEEEILRQLEELANGYADQPA